MSSTARRLRSLFWTPPALLSYSLVLMAAGPPSDTPGIERTRFNDVGGHITRRGSVFLDDVRIPAEFRLGKEGAAFSQVLAGFDYSRALIALQCIGAAQASVGEAWAYAQERSAFGGPIAQFQGVTFPLVEGETLLAAGRQLSLHALALRDAGAPHTVEFFAPEWRTRFRFGLAMMRAWA
jgi:cyclohexanecarboxyl-CoA dehydrogenase